MEGTSYLAYIPILVAVYLATIYLAGKLKNRPPSPFLNIPLIGHLYVVMNENIDALTNLANCLGPVIFLWFGSRQALLVSSPSAAEDCLNKNDIVFCNRPPKTLIGKYRGYDNTSLNFASYGPHWRNLRKIATVEMLSSHRLNSLAAIRADEVRLFIKRLYIVRMKQALLDQLKEEVVNFFKRLEAVLTLNVIFDLCAGGGSVVTPQPGEQERIDIIAIYESHIEEQYEEMLAEQRRQVRESSSSSNDSCNRLIW